MRGPGRGGGRWPSLGLDQKGTAPRLLRLPTNARRCVVGQRRKDLSARRRPRTRPFVAARGEKFAFFAIFFLSASPIHATSVLSSSIFSFPVPLHARKGGERLRSWNLGLSEGHFRRIEVLPDRSKTGVVGEHQPAY